MLASSMLILLPLQNSYEINKVDVQEDDHMPKIGFYTVGDNVTVTLNFTNHSNHTIYLKVNESFGPYQNINGPYPAQQWPDDYSEVNGNSSTVISHTFVAIDPELWSLYVIADGFDNYARLGLADPSYIKSTNYYIHPSSDRDIRTLADSMYNSSITSENNLNEVKDQNSTLQQTLIISSIIGIMTVIALYLTWSSSRKSTKQLESQVQELQKQNQAMEEDREITRRAWIGLGESHIHLHGYIKNGNFMNENQWNWQSPAERILGPEGIVQYYFEVKNYGQILAKHVKTRYKITTGDLPDRHVIESVEFSSSSIIMPQQIEKQFFELTEEEQIAFQSSNCYLIYEMEYESPTGKHRKFGSLRSISSNSYGTIESWDEND